MFDEWRVWHEGKYIHFDTQDYGIENYGGEWYLIYCGQVISRGCTPEFCLGNFNGVDVYEGDVVELNHRVDSCGEHRSYTEKALVELSIIKALFDADDVKVIGNHKETPELLEEQ